MTDPTADTKAIFVLVFIGLSIMAGFLRAWRHDHDDEDC